MKKLLGEYENQKAVCILFPYRTDVWRDDARPAQEMVIELVNTMAKYQPVVLGVIPELIEYVKENFSLETQVEMIPVKYNDSWARDTLSSVICDGNHKEVNAFGFNSYGAPLYTPYDADQKLNDSILRDEFKYPVSDVPLILEWGNLAPDGNGTLFAIEETIVNDNRNPGISKEDAEKILLEKTASRKLIWLPYGLDFDETGGHIDNVLAFADAHTILVSYTDDPSHPHYKKTQELYELLKSATNADGESYKLIKLPVPTPHIRDDYDSHDICDNDVSMSRLAGDTVLYTYVNFVVINGAVIVPKFNIPQDEEAVSIIRDAFPGRDIIPINAHEAFLGGGGFHCLTKHIN